MSITPTPSAPITIETDLVPLAEVQCRTHETIYFCRNTVKDGKVFKYNYSTDLDTWYRVQCNCCQFKGTDEEVVHPVLTDKQVRENARNHIVIRPSYSIFCPETRKMVIFEKQKKQKEEKKNINFRKYTFDPVNKLFENSTCTCSHCQETPGREDLEHGAQGLEYAHLHRDRHGQSLICLAVTWHNEHHGLMEVFCDRTGRIGKYRYNYSEKCYEMEEEMDVRVVPHDYTLLDTIWDSDLRFLYTEECKQLEEKVFYAYEVDDPKRYIRKYLFNAIYGQFERVKCTDCQFNQACVKWMFETVLKTAGKTKLLKTDREGRMLKTRAPVRILEKLTVKDIRKRRCNEAKLTSNKNSMLSEGEFEGWIMGKYSPKVMMSLDRQVNENLMTIIVTGGQVYPFYTKTGRKEDSMLVVEFLADEEEKEPEDKDKTIVQEDAEEVEPLGDSL